MANNTFSGRAPTAASFGAPLKPPFSSDTEEPVFVTHDKNMTGTQDLSVTKVSESTVESFLPQNGLEVQTDSPGSLNLQDFIPTETEVELEITSSTAPAPEPEDESIPEETLTAGSSTIRVDVDPAAEDQSEEELVITSAESQPVSDNKVVINESSVFQQEQKSTTEDTKVPMINLAANVGRVDRDMIELPYRVQKPRNKAIYEVLSEWRAVHRVPERLTIKGVIITNTGEPGLWDEGGFDDPEGLVIVAADSKGNRLVPVVTNCGLQVVNGRHALVPIKKGYIIVIGWLRGDRERQVVYTVTNATATATESSFDCRLEGVLDDGSWRQISAVPSEANFNLHGRSAPVLRAVRQQLHRKHSVVPGYTCDYIEHHFPLEDYNGWQSDPAVSELFREVEKPMKVLSIANKAFAPLTVQASAERALLMLVITLSPENQVQIYALGGMYDPESRSTKGRRLFYVRATMGKKDVFRYPDREETVRENFLDTETIKAVLLKQPGHTLATAFRRISNNADYDYFAK